MYGWLSELAGLSFGRCGRDFDLRFYILYLATDVMSRYFYVHSAPVYLDFITLPHISVMNGCHGMPSSVKSHCLWTTYFALVRGLDKAHCWYAVQSFLNISVHYYCLTTQCLDLVGQDTGESFNLTWFQS